MNQSPRRPRPTSAAARAHAKKLALRRKRRAQMKLALVLILLLSAVTAFAVGLSQCGLGAPTPPESSGPTESAPSGSESLDSESTPSSPSESEPDETLPPIAPTFALPSGVESDCVLLLHRESGQIIASKNASEAAYPASVTKIMTVIVALEQLDDPNATVTITEDLINRLVARNAARAGFLAGETVRAVDLMYAALLPSGADGSVGLAELISGSEEAFAVLMNEKAAALGMTQTHFVNATGLHENEHYSSCTDLAILLDYALENPVFREIFTTPIYHSPATNLHPDGVWMRSTMDKYLESEDRKRSYFLGGKTGYTYPAGLCLASLAEYEGEEYLLITLGAGAGESTPRYHIHDAVAIFDALFAELA